jgi:hypothetical protein
LRIRCNNLIGPGKHFNAPRPDKIQAAYFVQLNNLTSPNPVSFRLTPIWSWEDYALVALKDMQSWSNYFFYDGAFPYGNVYIWPIPDETIEVHLVCKSPIGFTVQIESGDITVAGVGYTNGNYLDIPFVSLTGFGSEATADVTVAGGAITAIVIHDPGNGYNISDKLTLDTALMGGVGAGFIYTVDTVTDGLDAEFNMPPEYEEAVHYNLCVRLRSMYQYPPDVMQNRLAKNALATIRQANIQIPTLKMPSSLKFGRNGNSFYIFNADAR